MARPDEDSEGELDPFEDVLRRAARLTPLPLPSQRAPTLDVGSEVCEGRFRVERRLGEGGMGMVYAAHDRERQTRVALKTLSRLDADGIYRLKREFRALEKVVHPNLVRLDELFMDQGRLLFSMQLVEGVPFDLGVRPDGVLDEQRLRHALPQLVAGVQAIHAAGKLHRDLKPSNVLVAGSGELIILDFGLAADPERGGAGQTVDSPWVAGTPAYMAPEQAAGDAMDEAADWYAVGVMLFEALTGELPFDGKAGAIMSAKQVLDAPSPASARDGLPADLVALCEALLAREAGERPSGLEVARQVGPAPAVVQAMSVAPPRGGAPLFGREAELSSVRVAFADAQAGRASLVRLSGASGLGKSAIAAAVLAELEGEAVVLSGRCYEKESLPFNAFDSLVDELSRHLKQLPYAEAVALMPRDVRALSRIFPVLERLEAVGATPLRPFFDEHELRRRAFDAFAELLGRMRDRAPLVIHVDDLQWADAESMRLFQHVLGQSELAPILWIASHRALEPGDTGLERLVAAARANRALTLTELDLGPLDPAAAADLARSLLDGAASREVGARIADEAVGNPFLIQELVRHVVAGGEAAGVSLEQALAARIDRLEPEAREVLEVVALCGRPVSVEVIAGAIDGDTPHGTLDLLRASQLVHASANHGHECYHDRIRQAVVARLSDARARALHGRLAGTLSALEGADPELLFEHSRAAGLPAAGEHAARAAARAVANLAFERGAELYGFALELGAGGDDPSWLLERRAEALSLSGRWVQSAEVFDRASEAAREPERRTYLLHQAGHHYLGSGRRAEGMPRLRQAMATLGLPWPRTGVGAALRALVRLTLLWLTGARSHVRDVEAPRHFDGLGRTEAHRYAPRADGSIDEAIRVEALLGAAGLIPPYDLWRGLYFVTAFAWRALRHGDADRTAVALGMLSGLFAGVPATRALSRRLGDEAVGLARERGADNLGSVALTCVSFARFFEGDLEQARVLAAEASHALRHAGRAYAYEAWIARLSHAFALILLGRPGEAQPLLTLNASEAHELGDELATLGGESILSALIDDDIVAAKALLARKRAALPRIGEAGGLRELLRLEEIFCALYCGEGAAAYELASPERGTNVIPFDIGNLRANCALQAIAAGGEPARYLPEVRRIARRAAASRTPNTEGLAAQLGAAVALAEGDRAAALAGMERAVEGYAAVSLVLHSEVARHVVGQLRGGADGELERRRADAFLRERGIASPERLVRMFAPGFTR